MCSADQYSICCMQGQNLDSVDQDEITVTVGEGSDRCIVVNVVNSVRNVFINRYLN